MFDERVKKEVEDERDQVNRKEKKTRGRLTVKAREGKWNEEEIS